MLFKMSSLSCLLLDEEDLKIVKKNVGHNGFVCDRAIAFRVIPNKVSQKEQTAVQNSFTAEGYFTSQLAGDDWSEPGRRF